MTGVRHSTGELWTSDGVALAAELTVPDGPPRAAAVLCHPHLQYGGTMHAPAVHALFRGLPPAGVACLRFDFRGAGASSGRHDDGDRERLDVAAAVALLVERTAGVPLLLAGWSFGADVALSVRDATAAGWYAVAPPLRYARELDLLGADPRPKLLVLAGADEVRDPAEVVAEAANWTNARAEVLPGESHWWHSDPGGSAASHPRPHRGTRPLVEHAAAFVDQLVQAG